MAKHVGRMGLIAIGGTLEPLPPIDDEMRAGMEWIGKMKARKWADCPVHGRIEGHHVRMYSMPRPGWPPMRFYCMFCIEDVLREEGVAELHLPEADGGG